MEQRSLPKIFFSLSSARISRLFCGFWRLFLRIWSQTLLTTWLRGNGSGPVIAARSADGFTGRCNPLLASAIIASLWCYGVDRAQFPLLGNGGRETKRAGLTPVCVISVD